MKTNYTLTDLNTVAQSIVQLWTQPILIVNAPMGAGKTTLIKEICLELGIKQPVSSPTFSLVNSYLDSENNPFYHFDLYRLNSLSEAMDIGIEEYLDSGNRCVIEWPDSIRDLLPEHFHEIKIEIMENGSRTLFFDV